MWRSSDAREEIEEVMFGGIVGVPGSSVLGVAVPANALATAEATNGVACWVETVTGSALSAGGKAASTILMILPGVFPFRMTVATPAAVARSAAISFVCMPPVPKLLPMEETCTAFLAAPTLCTAPSRLASGSVRGLPVYRPSTSVQRKRK